MNSLIAIIPDPEHRANNESPRVEVYADRITDLPKVARQAVLQLGYKWSDLPNDGWINVFLKGTLLNQVNVKTGKFRSRQFADQLEDA